MQQNDRTLADGQQVATAGQVVGVIHENSGSAPPTSTGSLLSIGACRPWRSVADSAAPPSPSPLRHLLKVLTAAEGSAVLTVSLTAAGAIHGAGSSGHVPSNSSRYFSVDMGMIHLIALDLNPYFGCDPLGTAAIEAQKVTPTTWTTFQKDGPNHLGLW